MLVQFDPKRPCDQNKKNGYTREELDALANANEIHDHHNMTMDQICDALKSMNNPFSAEVFGDWTVDVSESAGIKKELEIFLREFHDDLTKWWQYSSPSFRAVISGGFGVKMLLEQKYGIYHKIRTTDIDITISIHNAWYSADDVRTHIENKLKALKDTISQRRGTFYWNVDGGLNWNFFKFTGSNQYNPYFKMHRYGIFIITLDDQDFVDIAITDIDMPARILDKSVSENAKPLPMPIKNTEAQLKEFLSLIYMENVPGARDYAYWIRNPIRSKYPQKGIKDIERARLLCRETKERLFKKYCGLIANFTLNNYKKMPKEERDSYFEDLRKALYIEPRPSKSALGDPTKLSPEAKSKLYPDIIHKKY